MRTLSTILLACFLIGVASVGVESRDLGATYESPMDCTFTIKGNFSGTLVDIQITVSDVTFLECTLLKMGVKKALK
jgi:hypothetical protein